MRKKFIITEERKARKFDPDLTTDFIAKNEFEQLCGDSKKFNTICNQLSEYSLEELKSEYDGLFQIIEKDVESEFEKHKKNNSTIISLDEFDKEINNIIDQQLDNLLAYIRVALYKINKIDLYDVQLIAGLQLYQGKVLEMKTGEGKTFVIPIAAVLHGIRVKILNQLKYEFYEKNKFDDNHYFQNYQIKIVTANDYLARRDYIRLKDFYFFFSLSSYYIQENTGRQENTVYYDFEILYCTCRHLCHLSLYDMMRKEDQSPFLPLKNYVAILDEIDQILLDESLTPHIISEGKANKTYEIDIVYQANHFTNQLVKQNRIFLDNEKSILTESFKYYLSQLVFDFSKEYKGKIKADDNIITQTKYLYNLFEEIRHIPDYSIQRLQSILAKSQLYLKFLDLLEDKLKIFIQEYIPFLLKTLSCKIDEFIFSQHSKKIAELIKYFSNYDFSEFGKDFLNIVLSRNHLTFEENESFLRIFEVFLSQPDRFHSIEFINLTTEFVQQITDKILKYFAQINVGLISNDIFTLSDTENFKNFITKFISEDLPKISNFFFSRNDTIAYSLFIDIKQVNRLLHKTPEGKLRLNPKIQKLVEKQELSNYLVNKLSNLEDLQVLQNNNIMELVSKVMVININLPVYSFLTNQLFYFTTHYPQNVSFPAIPSCKHLAFDLF